MKRILVLLLAIGTFVGIAHAHNGMQHVMGIVTVITDTNITVKTMDGKMQDVALSPETKYVKGTNAVSLRDIKVGDHIVIHAAKKGDQLTAAEVKVGMMMKGMHGDMSGMKMDSKSQTTPQ